MEEEKCRGFLINDLFSLTLLNGLLLNKYTIFMQKYVCVSVHMHGSEVEYTESFIHGFIQHYILEWTSL